MKGCDVNKIARFATMFIINGSTTIKQDQQQLHTKDNGTHEQHQNEQFKKVVHDQEVASQDEHVVQDLYMEPIVEHQDN